MYGTPCRCTALGSVQCASARRAKDRAKQSARRIGPAITVLYPAARGYTWEYISSRRQVCGHIDFIIHSRESIADRTPPTSARRDVLYALLLSPHSNEFKFSKQP